MGEGRLKNSVRNIAYRLASQVASILLKFISRTVFIYILGVEYLGISGLFSEILTVLSLADLGFGTAMVFSMYKPLAEQDKRRLAQLVGLYKRIYTVIAIAIAVIGVALIPVLKYLVNLEHEIPHLTVYYLLYLANTVASYIVVYKTCILNADQKSYVVAKYNTIFSFLSLIATTVTLAVTRNFIAYLIVSVAFTYIGNYYVSHIAEKEYPYINEKVPKLPKQEGKEIFNNVKSVFIYKAANILVGSTDNTLISLLAGTAAVGYYSNYSMVITNITMFINTFFSSVTASLGNLVVEANNQKNYGVYRKMQLISFILSTVAIAGTFLMIDDLILVWLGERFLLDGMVVVAISVNLYFSVILMPIWSFREATGMYRQTKYVMVMTAIVNLIMSIVLGRKMGLAGILFATSIARISTYFWYEPKLLFKQFFNVKASNYYIGVLKNIIITCVVTFICWILFGKIEVTSWMGFFAKTMIVGMCALVLTVSMYCKILTLFL